MSDPINPDHYKWHPSGVECVQISQEFPSNLGQAIQYIWRAGKKSDQPVVRDLEKAVWFLQAEIRRHILREKTKESGDA